MKNFFTENGFRHLFPEIVEGSTRGLFLTEGGQLSVKAEEKLSKSQTAGMHAQALALLATKEAYAEMGVPHRVKEILAKLPKRYRQSSAMDLITYMTLAPCWEEKAGSYENFRKWEVYATKELVDKGLVKAWHPEKLRMYFETFNDQLADSSRSYYNGRVKSSGNICRRFNTPKGCRFKATCRFVHKCSKCNKAGHAVQDCSQ